MSHIYKNSYFKIGELVSVIDDNLTGLVVKILGSKVWLSTELGFEYCYESKELIRVCNNLFKDEFINLHIKCKKNTKKKLVYKPVKKLKNKKTLKVDLHIEKLLEFPEKYPKKDWLSIQLNETRKTLNECIQKNRRQLIFIHGQGEGILKKALHKLLNEYSNIEYFDAPYREYGTGATEIYIHYNIYKKPI